MSEGGANPGRWRFNAVVAGISLTIFILFVLDLCPGFSGSKEPDIKKATCRSRLMALECEARPL